MFDQITVAARGLSVRIATLLGIIEAQESHVAQSVASFDEDLAAKHAHLDEQVTTTLARMGEFNLALDEAASLFEDLVPQEEEIDLTKLSLAQLRAMAEDYGMAHAGLKKAALVELLAD